MKNSLCIVMVEDDDGHATLVQRNLRRAGFSSDPVRLHDGQELLDYVYHRGQWQGRTQHHSLALIVDLNMPRMGGLEALQVLKGDADVARIPVYVITTSDNPLEIDRCYQLGAAACLVKPVDYGAFSSMVQRLAAFLMAARMPGETAARQSNR